MARVISSKWKWCPENWEWHSDILIFWPCKHCAYIYIYIAVCKNFEPFDIYQYIHISSALWEGFSFRKHSSAQKNHQHVATGRYSCSLYWRYYMFNIQITHTHTNTNTAQSSLCMFSVLLLTGTEVSYLVELLHISDIYYCWVWFRQSAFVTDRWTLEYADYQKQNNTYLGQLWSLGRDSKRATIRNTICWIQQRP